MRLSRQFLVILTACALMNLPVLPAPAEEDMTQNISVQVLKGSLSKTQTETLTLLDALKMAQEDNPTLKAAGDAVNQAKAQYYTRLAEMLPNAEATYGQAHYEGAVQGFGNEIFMVDRKTYLPQLLFRFPIFQGGRQFFQVRSAQKALSAQRSTEQGTLQQTLRQTALNYYELKRRLDVISIAQKQLEESQAQLDLNTARMEAGAGTRLDVLQSESQVARAKQQVLEAVQASQVAALALNEILALPAISTVVPPDGGQQMQTLIPLGGDFQKLLAMAQENRPELKTLTHQAEALMELRKLAWSAYFPEVALQYRTGGVGGSFDSIKHYDESALSLDLSLPNLGVPVLTRYKENTAQLAQLKHQIEAQNNGIQREVSEAYLEALTRQAQVTVSHTEITASEQALSDAIERLKVGVGRNIDVLDAETSLTRARTTLSTTILQYNQAQVNLVYALGLASVESLTQGIQQP